MLKASSRASRAKITALRIKAEFQQKRAQQQLDAERQQIEADLKMKRQQIEADLNMERQHREAQLQASHRERELTQLQIQEELAIAVAEDTIINDTEDCAFPRPPQIASELSSPPHGAAEILGVPLLSDPHETPSHNPPEFSFYTDRDIVNNMPPPSNAQECEGSYVTAAPASTPPAKSATVLSDAIQKMATLSQHSKLPSAEVQVFDGDPCSYQRFLSSFRYVVEINTSDPSA